MSVTNNLKRPFIYSTDGKKVLDLNRGSLIPISTKVVGADLSDNTETSTGLVIPTGAIVLDVVAVVNTAESTATTTTIDIGTDSTDSGDADGYFDGLAVGAVGVHSSVSATVTTGANETYVSALGGALLGSGVVGTNADGDFGLWQSDIDTASAGKEITVTFGDAGGANELDLDIYVYYILRN